LASEFEKVALSKAGGTPTMVVGKAEAAREAGLDFVRVARRIKCEI